MAGPRSRRAERRGRTSPRLLRLALLVSIAVPAGTPAPAAAREPLRDAPVVWYADDRENLAAEPAERDPNLLWNYAEEGFIRPIKRWTQPSHLIREIGTWFGGQHAPRARDVNALGEVPNSSWFTNRIGFFPVTPEEAARGPATNDGPALPWVVTGAKTEGVTPGFRIRDAHGDVYFIKFDSPGFQGMASTAGVISGKILHAAGYNVPEDGIVHFRREDLTVAEGVTVKEKTGARPLTGEFLDAILARVAGDGHGGWRAIYSRLLPGSAIGPFNYVGRRDDDPNDHIDHQDRRTLRGLRMFASWLYHFDTKQHNSLDMFVEDDGRHYVRHYLIDFASTLGAGGLYPAPRYNWEYTLDPLRILGRTVALGFSEDDWRRVQRPPGLSEVAYFEAERYDPWGWRPIYPNPAFVEMDDLDAYWAAKIISAFTDEQLHAITDASGYENPDASRYVARTLAARRDKIARAAFERVAPLDYFAYQEGRLRFRDLAVERNVFPDAAAPHYQARVSGMTADRGAAGWSDWFPVDAGEVDLTGGAAEAADRAAPREKYPFLAVQLRADRGDGTGPSVIAYIARPSGRVVAVDR